MAERYKLYVDKKGRKESGLYVNSDGQFYLRIREGERNTYLSLQTKSPAVAIKFRDARRTAKVAAKLGLAVDPNEAAKNGNVTVAIVLDRYIKDGYPDKKGVARKPGKHLEAEKAYCETLKSYFKGEKAAALLTQHDLDEYHTWRVAQVTSGNRKGRGTGHRITDLELNALNNAMRWAVRKQLLRSNPILSRARYHTSNDAVHCREFSFSSADELHAAAGALMSSTRSESLGWQLLFEGLTGLRTEEILRLRMDAQATDPGWVAGDSLTVRRAKKAVNENPCVQINEGLRQVIAAHKVWHAARYPNSPWYFPGRDRQAAKAVDKGVLTKALGRLFKKKVLKRKHTSHGARAYYVLLRRSQGISDTQIAAEINHTGGVGTLERVYGIIPPHWKDGQGPNMSWVPKGPVAWTNIKKVAFPVAPAPAAPPKPAESTQEATTFDI